MAALTTIALGIGAAATVASYQQQQKAAKSQAAAAATAREQYATEQKRAEVQNIRSVRQQIRQTRLAQASMTNVGAQAGGMGGSGLEGGIASLGSQMGGNLDYMATIAAYNTTIGQQASQYSSQMAQANIASTKANMYGQVGQLGYTMFKDFA
jgi:hypothetical protein